MILPKPSGNCHLMCLKWLEQLLDGPGDDTASRRCFDNSSLGYFMVFAQSVWGKYVRCEMSHHYWTALNKCFAFIYDEKSHVQKTYLLSTWGAHLCSMTTQMWPKWETETSNIAIHLSRQPLFHFHPIKASRLHCTKHISAGANISLFHLPQQAGRIFHQNRPLSSHLRDTASRPSTTGSWSCSKWSNNPVARLRSMRNAYPLHQIEPENFTAKPAHNMSKQVLGVRLAP